jgi:hypothetical protein
MQKHLPDAVRMILHSFPPMKYSVPSLGSPVQIVNGMNRALFLAFSAADAFVKVDMRKIILHCNGALLALTGAKPAADAPSRADTLHGWTPVSIGAPDGNLCRAIVHPNNASGASLGAQAAADTLGRIHNRNAIAYGNRFLGADPHAASQSQAAIRTAGKAQAAEHRSAAVRYADVLRFWGSCAAGSGAGNICLLRIRVNRISFEDRRYLCDIFRAVSGADIHTDAMVDNCVRSGVAACISAGAAICPPQAFTDSCDPIVFLHIKFFAGSNQCRAENQPYQANYQGRNQHHIHVFSSLSPSRQSP